MEFPRLNDTGFPHLSESDPYSFKNEFDYSKWQADCRIKLCNVPWHVDYKHTVDWRTDAARDAWFDALEGSTIELGSDSRRVMDSVPVPLTYQQAQRYNYCCIEAEYPDIDYSDTPRRLYYFIIGLEYRSPNATMLELQMDYWTTYINHVSVPYLMLARGHAPMDACSASEYLRDPLANSRWLGAPDVDFSTGAMRIASHRMRDFGAADKVVCFASVVPFDEFDQMVAVGSSSPGTDPVFSDTNDRYGYQLRVSGYQWRTGYDYTNTSMPSRPLGSPDGNVPSYWIYGIPADELMGSNGRGISIIQSKYPFFIKSCTACFILPDDIIDARFIRALDGMHFYSVSPRADTGFRFDIDTAMFDYPAEYAGIAKLYSMPYAHLEVSNDAGETMIIRVEDISGNGLEAVNQLNLAAPFLDWSIVLGNVNGSGYSSAEWVDLTGSSSRTDVLEAGYRYVLELGIPTYALLLSREKETQSGGFANAMKARENALLDYTMNARSTNTGHANGLDSNATMVTNTANSGSTATANTALSVAAASSQTANANNASYVGTSISNAAISQNQYNDASLQQTAIDTQRDAMTSTNVNSMMGGITSAIASAIPSAGAGVAALTALGAAVAPGALLAGAIVTPVLSAASAAINVATANQNSVISFNASAAIAQATINNAAAHAQTLQLQASEMQRNHASAQTDATDISNTLATNLNSNNVALANTTAANSAATTNNNSLQSRNITIMNAQDRLRNAQRNYEYDLDAAKQGSPIQYGANTGNPTADAYGRKVVSVRAVTESPNAIRQAGDWFNRYGYAFNAIWQLDSWTTGKAFTYWQASETWIDGDSTVTDNVRMALDTILQNGVTVWQDADEIGKVAPNGR